MIVVAAAAGLLIRPYLQRVEGAANPYVAALQRISQLPVDPRRLYAEDSLYWVVWYLGVPALLLGVAGLALLTRRCLRALITWQDPTGMARAWALPLMIIGWGAVAVLWLPHTMPDQPWASRQLVPVLLPGLIVAAIWVCALLAVRARQRGAGVVAIAAAVACFVAALAVPSVVTTFGIGARQLSPPAPYPASAAPAFQRTGIGQLAAITNLCGAIPGDSPVLILDQVAARRFTQVIRGMCGTPAGVMAGATAGPGAGGRGPDHADGAPGGAARHPPGRAHPLRGDAPPGGQPDDDRGRTCADPATGVGLARALCPVDVGAGSARRGRRPGGRGMIFRPGRPGRRAGGVICLRDVRALK